MLPHIVLDSQLQYPSGRSKWVCHDNYYLWGHGATPEAAFDWRSQPVNREWYITSIKTESGSKGAAVTAPKMFHVFQKAVK